MAVHTNQLIYLPYIRASAEIEGATANSLNKKPFVTPNGVLGLKLGEDMHVYRNVKEKIRDKMMRVLGNCFVDISKAKALHKQVVQNAFQTFVTKIKNVETLNMTCVNRALRAYKIYLLHFYCDHTLEDFYCLSLHLQLMDVSNHLRFLAKLIPEDEPLFECTKSSGLENISFNSGYSFSLEDPPFVEQFDQTENYASATTLLYVPSTEEIARMIKRASLINHTKSDQISYELSMQNPEELIKMAIKKGTKNNPEAKQQKKWMRKENASGLCQYNTYAFEMLNGLTLVHNVMLLELIVESTHFPMNTWYRLIKDQKMNTITWKHGLNRKRSILESDVPKKIEKTTDTSRDNLELMLRNIAHKIKVVDNTLFKTCLYKMSSAIDYFYFMYKVITLYLIFSINICV